MGGDSAFQMNKEDVKFLATLPGNKECIECGKSNPEWASVSLGVLFCIDCSGKHRGLGTHISFVRSITMDSWSDLQIQKMRKGGNQQCKDFLTKHGIDVVQNTTITTREKYDTPAAFLYQEVLKARVAGTPEPTELPKIDRKPAEKRPMQGFGSSPPPQEEHHTKRNVLLGTAVSVGAVLAMAILKK